MAVSKSKQSEIDTDQDRYPTFKAALSRIARESEFADTAVERLEVHCFASGEATYRIWLPRAEDPEGGYFESI